MRFLLFFLMLNFMPFAMSEPSNRLEIQKVSDKVYALVGQRGPMSK